MWNTEIWYGASISEVGPVAGPLSHYTSAWRCVYIGTITIRDWLYYRDSWFLSCQCLHYKKIIYLCVSPSFHCYALMLSYFSAIESHSYMIISHITPTAYAKQLISLVTNNYITLNNQSHTPSGQSIVVSKHNK